MTEPHSLSDSHTSNGESHDMVLKLSRVLSTATYATGVRGGIRTHSHGFSSSPLCRVRAPAQRGAQAHKKGEARAQGSGQTSHGGAVEAQGWFGTAARTAHNVSAVPSMQCLAG